MSKRANSFFLYCKEFRDEVKESNPMFSNSEVTSELGKRWRSMPPSKKKEYTSKAQDLREEYKKMGNSKPVVKPAQHKYQSTFRLTKQCSHRIPNKKYTRYCRAKISQKEYIIRELLNRTNRMLDEVLPLFSLAPEVAELKLR